LEKAPNRSSQSQVRYLTGLFAFNHDEFVIMRNVKRWRKP
jgi:hypothetical protein